MENTRNPDYSPTAWYLLPPRTHFEISGFPDSEFSAAVTPPNLSQAWVFQYSDNGVRCSMCAVGQLLWRIILHFLRSHRCSSHQATARSPQFTPTIYRGLLPLCPAHSHVFFLVSHSFLIVQLRINKNRPMLRLDQLSCKHKHVSFVVFWLQVALKRFPNEACKSLLLTRLQKLLVAYFPRTNHGHNCLGFAHAYRSVLPSLIKSIPIVYFFFKSDF